MQFINFVLDNLAIIIFLIAAIIIAVGALKADNSRTMKQIIFYLVVQSERQYDASAESLKTAYIMLQLAKHTPMIVRFLYPYKEVLKYIDEARSLFNEFEKGKTRPVEQFDANQKRRFVMDKTIPKVYAYEQAFDGMINELTNGRGDDEDERDIQSTSEPGNTESK